MSRYVWKLQSNGPGGWGGGGLMGVTASKSTSLGKTVWVRGDPGGQTAWLASSKATETIRLPSSLRTGALEWLLLSRNMCLGGVDVLMQNQDAL